MWYPEGTTHAQLSDFRSEMKGANSNHTGASYEHTEHQIWHFTNTEPIIFTQCNEGIQNYNSQRQEIKNPYMQDLFPREKVTWVFTALLYQYFRRKIKRPIKTLQTDPLLSTEQNLFVHIQLHGIAHINYTQKLILKHW
jgi:hypothetical protein